MQFTLLLFFLLISFFAAEAQLVHQVQGARAAGMGGASAPVTDVWALNYNIGALAGVQQINIAAGYHTRYNLPELSTASLVISMPVPVGIAGAGVSRYGFGPYSITEGTLGLARQIGLVAIGLQGGFVQVATKGFGSRMVPLLSFGGTAQLLPKVRFGGFVYNITQSQISPETAEYLPTLLRAGLQWQPTDLFLLVVETEKDVDYRASFKAGLEYKLREVLVLRTGFSTQPSSLHGGFGLRPGSFKLDYALQHHRYIGLMHHVTFCWQLKKGS